MIQNKHLNFAGSKIVMDGDKIVYVKSKEQRLKYKDYENIQQKVEGERLTLQDRYRIPPALIKEIFWIVSKV
jgi:hypothetical protein